MASLTAKYYSLRLFALLSLLSASAFGAFGSQPWDKPASTWTRADVSRILTNSPWAQQAEGIMADPRDNSDPQQDSAPVPPPSNPAINGPGGTSDPTAPRWDGQIARNRMGHLATVPVAVRWESATPIREALDKAGTPNKPETGNYVISVQGLVPAGKYRSAGQTESTSQSDGSTDARNPEEVLESFMAYSRLVPRGRAAFRPQNVRLDAATGTVYIFFPRTHPFESASKEVDFITHFGALNVRAKFRPAAMKYQGKLDL